MSPNHKAAVLESTIRQMTQPINGQYPPPWMTSSTDPASAKVFTVGKNPRNMYRVEDVGSHDYYVDTLFNRGPETCRDLYRRLSPKISPTRKNTDNLVEVLEHYGVTNIIQTNVVPYSTPMSADLKKRKHAEGAARAREIFQAVLAIVEPKVLIAHGAGTVETLSGILKHPLPHPPEAPTEPIMVQLNQLAVFVIPSLAPPRYNKWSYWAQDYIDLLGRRVSEHLATLRTADEAA